MPLLSKRTRSARVASLAIRPANWLRLLEHLRRGDVLVRLALCLLTALIVWGVTEGWKPPFAFRTGYVPRRDIVARVKFAIPDPPRTEKLKEIRRRETVCFYQHDPQPIIELRETLKSKLAQIVQAEAWDKLSDDVRAELFPTAEPPVAAAEAQHEFDKIRTAFAEDKELTRFEQTLQKSFAEWERNGLLDRLDPLHTDDEGSQVEIRVHPVGKEELAQRVEIEHVRISRITSQLKGRIIDELRGSQMEADPAMTTAQLCVDWLKKHLRPTLTYNKPASDRAREEGLNKIDANPAMLAFEAGKSPLAKGGRPIDTAELELLQREHAEFASQLGWGARLGHSLASLGLYIAMYILCGCYVYYREPRLLESVRRLATLLAMVVLTIILCRVTSENSLRAEMVPLILFGMTMAIAYEQEMALLLSAAVALVVTLALGQGMAQFVMLSASVASSILLLGRIRSRTKLINVGLVVAAVSFLTSLGVCTIDEQAFGAPSFFPAAPAFIAEHLVPTQYLRSLLAGAAWAAACSVMAGVLMTGMLPFVERAFDVQTDLKLLELGDIAHPLLQELVRRAPGTYNHSINVASIAEAAAEAIDANGLLVRVGAYFHDIGKMLIPSYYIENQGQDASRHLSLLPAMSTLVIIAHVKDGANLARQHSLPQSLIDFIEQHHGTTLVEYFYHQATKQSESDPDSAEVDESNFRYPGPKPQTKEAGVLMLADAVESASRTLVDPTPARIENLVHDLAMKRLLDGQFEECGLTLQEVHVIEESLVKTLTAVYHGRVKYPDQQTA